MSTGVKQMIEAANAAVPRISPAQAQDMIAAGQAVVIDVQNAQRHRMELHTTQPDRLGDYFQTTSQLESTMLPSEALTGAPPKRVV